MRNSEGTDGVQLDSRLVDLFNHSKTIYCKVLLGTWDTEMKNIPFFQGNCRLVGRQASKQQLKFNVIDSLIKKSTTLWDQGGRETSLARNLLTRGKTEFILYIPKEQNLNQWVIMMRERFLTQYEELIKSKFSKD